MASRTLEVLPDGLFSLLVYPGDNTYRVAVPVDSPINVKGFECVLQKSGKYISTIHYGDYSYIGAAYDKLICYAQERKLRTAPPFIERYFQDSTCAFSPARYITQVLIEITP